jgi:biotin carboxyl carrier protein
MKAEIRIGDSRDGQNRRAAQHAECTRDGNHLHVTLDGRVINADAVEVTAGTYSVLVGGQAYEVWVEPAGAGLRVHADAREFNIQIADPRAWARKRGGALEAEGRQEVVAPMPGKVVRVLVQEGGAVEAGQGILVVEAMKMQNEVRSPKKGKVEKLLVKEGQVVNANESLAVVA